MFLLMRDNGVLGLFPPLCRFRDLGVKIESITAQKHLQFGGLHAVIVRQRVGELAQKPLLFDTRDGHRRGHTIEGSARPASPSEQN